MLTADVLMTSEMTLKVYENLIEAAKGSWETVPECPMCRCCLRQHPASLCTRCMPTRKLPWGELSGLKALLVAMHEADQLDSFEDPAERNYRWATSAALSHDPRLQNATHHAQNDKEDGTGFGGDSTDHKRLSRRHEILRAKKLHQTLVLPRYVEILSTLGFSHDFQPTSIPLGHWAELRRSFFPLIRTWLRSSFFDLVGDSCLQVESKIRPTLQIFARWFQAVLQGPRQETALCSLIFLLFEPYEPDESRLTLASVLSMQVIVALLSRLYEQAQSYLQKVGPCKDKYDRQTLLAWDLTRLYAMCRKVLETPLMGSVWQKVKDLTETSDQETIELHSCANLRLNPSSSSSSASLQLQPRGTRRG
eukprot:GEMP01019702.1.p1 GENE.GEMP01019702.1~~GEMP01019702.1.p1  ORF type:complete len:364 (+),score=49.08 GEMP01019702.1:593-1684(+)